MILGVSGTLVIVVLFQFAILVTAGVIVFVLRRWHEGIIRRERGETTRGFEVDAPDDKTGADLG